MLFLQGRLLHILPAKQPPKVDESGNSADPQAKSSYKKLKELKLKKTAGDAQSWNPLFIKGDTVASGAAERIGVQKSEFLDPTAKDSLAVRVRATLLFNFGSAFVPLMV